MTKSVAIIGGGPAGLMAAEVLAQAGCRVTVFDAMPSVGRKFLLAGVGGMNITHSEAYAPFVSRYAEQQDWVAGWLADWQADHLREWIHALGIETFIGTSGRVFPREMKAAPLLRAWLHRLRELGVVFQVRHRWQGWTVSNTLQFMTPAGEVSYPADAVVLALGGASWPKLGSDGAWVPLLDARQIDISPLMPSNMGFECEWSDYFRTRFAGHPLKNVAVHYQDYQGRSAYKRGECLLTVQGIEGGLIYAVSASLRRQLLKDGKAILNLDLLPDLAVEKVQAAIQSGRGAKSLSSHLSSKLGVTGVKFALLREVLSIDDMQQPERLAQTIKSLPVTLTGMRPLEEAISTAGGIRRQACTDTLMLRALPGVFCAGEMLDWEAPTGGYLLTACFASGRHAANGVMQWLRQADL
ncbi:TIGR03862 family flavoprotein [Leeia oryzae]|uniref:TIGR03862 family flavoprotein n=1 Tax=Leeia oryzae TaxID=356662 RepID=UPI001FE03FFE|nr:TIGR03862 family flavoprotein [Leeia oryzae]